MTFIKVPTLNTTRLFMRPIVPGDREEIFAIFSDPAVTRYYDVPTMRKIESADKLILWWQKRIEKQKALRWGIVFKEVDRLVGTCGFSELDLAKKKAEIAIDIQQEFWHKGIMKEALAAVIEYGFNTLNLDEIDTWIMSGNQHSIAGIRSLGFIGEGKLSKFFWRGRFHDRVRFVLKKEAI